VKRIALLALAALAFWGVSTAIERSPSDGASITLVSKDPAAMRATVLSKVVSWGGHRLSEMSEFDGEARSDLRFRVPTDRLEQILTGLGRLGATVKEQQISVDEDAVSDEAADHVSRLRACLAQIGNGVGIDTVTGCRDDLRAVADHLSATGSTVPTAVLSVHVGGTGGGSALLAVGGLLGLVIIAVSLAVVVRSARRDDDIDLRIDGVEPFTDEAYSRRN
jgi:hypothetical protein